MRHLSLALAVVLLAWLVWWLSDATSPPPSGGLRTLDSEPVAVSTATTPSSDEPTREPVATDAAAAPIAATTMPENAATAELRVVVVDRPGNALPGCRVRVMVRTTTAAEAVTDDAGRVRFTLPRGRHRVDVTPADERFAPVDGRVTVEPDVPELRIVLEPRSRLPFCVRLSIGEPPRPFAAARTTLHRHGGATEDLTSDATGTVEMLAGDHRDTLIVAASPANGPCFVVPMPGHDTRATALPVLVPAPATVDVRVVDAADRPLGDRSVTLTADGRGVTWPAGAFTRSGIEPMNARTDAEGIARFTMLPAGVTVTAAVVDESLPAPPSRELPLAAGPNTLLLRIEECAIRGIVVDDAGDALADVIVGVEYQTSLEPPPVMHVVRAAAHTTRTDGEGRFTFAHFGPGRWLVGVVPSAERDVPLEPVCRVVDSAAGAVTDVELRTRPAGFLEARTVLADGTPAAGVSVDVQTADERAHWVTAVRSDADGLVRIGPLPRGEWALGTDVFDDRLGLLTPVVARTGDRDVRLVLHPTMVDVRVDVVDETGQPRFAAVWMRHRTAGDALGFGSGLDGRAEHRGLRAGTWDVTASDDSGNVAWLDGVQLVPGEHPTRLRLETRRGGTIVVPCPAEDGLEIWCVRGTRVGFNDFVQRGEVRRVTLPEGPWTVELRRGNDVVRSSNVQLTPGGEPVVRW